MDDGLLRQRRNLLSISIALMLYMLSGAKLDSILGLKIPKTGVAVVFVWVGFFYFLLRYYIYASSSKMKALLKNDVINATALDPKVHNAVESAIKEVSFKNVISTTHAHESGLRLLNIEFGKDKYGNFVFIFPQYKVEGEMKHVSDERYTDISEENIRSRSTIRINYLTGMYLTIRSRFIAAIFYKAITDYYLPYVVATLTALIGLIKLAMSDFTSSAFQLLLAYLPT